MTITSIVGTINITRIDSPRMLQVPVAVVVLSDTMTRVDAVRS